MKLYTCKGGLPEHETLKQTCKANKRNATTKNGKFAAAPNKCCRSGFVIPYYHYNQKRNEQINIGLNFCRRWTFENAPLNLKTSAVIQHVKNKFECTRKTTFPTPVSGCLFSCLITYESGCKIGHRNE